MAQPALEVRHVKKSFRLPTEQANGIKQAFVNWTKGIKGYKEQQVLRDISFTVEKGDFFGIVGRNGSGKSTLLKLISQIYVPDAGTITVHGNIVPFIELGVGFNPELTGRENVYLNGALLGFSHQEVSAMYDDVVAFAELADFMDQKLKNYSSGMQVRLAFSIAIKAQGSILVLDEVLAVGDEAFQRKCYEYFAQLKREKRTVILVTHDMSSVQRFCNKAILIDHGEITVAGNTAKVTDAYQKLNMPVAAEEPANETEDVPVLPQSGRIDTQLTVAGKPTEVVDGPRSKRLCFVVTVTTDIDIEDAFFGFTIRKDDGLPVFWYTTEPPHQEIKQFRAGHPVTLRFDIDNIFGDGAYFVDVSVKSNDRTTEYIIQNQTLRFTIAGWGKNGWMLHPATKVTIQP